MINVIASIRIKEGKVPEFIEIFKSNLLAVREEKGCIEYFPAIDIDANLLLQNFAENTVTIIEKWASLEDLYAHLEAPHMRSYRDKVKNLIEALSLKILAEA